MKQRKNLAKVFEDHSEKLEKLQRERDADNQMRKEAEAKLAKLAPLLEDCNSVCRYIHSQPDVKHDYEMYEFYCRKESTMQYREKTLDIVERQIKRLRVKKRERKEKESTE